MDQKNKKKVNKSNMLEAGLYVVSLPIGNALDITTRAKNILSQCDLIAAEDTRVTKKLLNELEIKAPRLLAYHAHNEMESAKGIIELIKNGNAVALVSDAGTPAISDPGTRVIREVHKTGHKVFPIPGPSSLTTALSVSGLSGGSIFFGGFLPAQKSARENTLVSALPVAQVLVFFEAPHRLRDTLDTIEALLGQNHEICVCRELTKTFETVLFTTTGMAKKHFQINEPRGEIVLVIKGKLDADLLDEQKTKEKVAELLATGRSSSDILEELQAVSSLTRRNLYNLIQSLKKI